jgi:hypothetical protein
MIKYNFGIECDLSWNKFLCVDVNSERMYRQDFVDFNELFYFIEKNKNHITRLLFDGGEYILENGLLHNLYGPARVRYIEKEDDHSYIIKGTTEWFYINGKLVSDQQDFVRGCKNKKDFENNEIFFYEEVTNKQSGRDKSTGIYYRRKESVDYIKHYINLEKLRKQDIRKKKLIKISGDN